MERSTQFLNAKVVMELHYIEYRIVYDLHGLMCSSDSNPGGQQALQRAE
jgi:hypothetical protein